MPLEGKLTPDCTYIPTPPETLAAIESYGRYHAGVVMRGLIKI